MDEHVFMRHALQHRDPCGACEQGRKVCTCARKYACREPKRMRHLKILRCQVCAVREQSKLVLLHKQECSGGDRGSQVRLPQNRYVPSPRRSEHLMRLSQVHDEIQFLNQEAPGDQCKQKPHCFHQHGKHLPQRMH